METRENRLRIIIKEFFGTQETLAKFLDVGTATISRYLNGKTSIYLDIVDKLSEFGISSAWFIEGKGNIFADSPAGEALREQSLSKYSDKDFLPKYLVKE